LILEELVQIFHFINLKVKLNKLLELSKEELHLLSLPFFILKFKQQYLFLLDLLKIKEYHQQVLKDEFIEL
jgi:hypothetical protein